MPPGVEARVNQALIRFRLAWAAPLVAVPAIAGLGIFALAGGLAESPGIPSLGSAAIAGAAVLCGIAVLLLDRSLLSPGRFAARIPFPDLDLALRYLLVGQLALWSIAVLPAILGFAQLLLGGALRTHLALCALSLGSLAVLMPTRARIRARVAAVVAGR